MIRLMAMTSNANPLRAAVFVASRYFVAFAMGVICTLAFGFYVDVTSPHETNKSAIAMGSVARFEVPGHRGQPLELLSKQTLRQINLYLLAFIMS